MNNRPMINRNECQKMFIKDLLPGTKNLMITFIVLKMSSDIYRTKDGNLVRTCSVADGSGMVNVSLWGDYCEAVQPGDVIELIRGHTQLFKNQLTVYLTKGGTLRKIDELCMIYNDYPNMSEPNPEWIKNHSEKQLQQITSRR